jgi:hypothetical protein
MDNLVSHSRRFTAHRRRIVAAMAAEVMGDWGRMGDVDDKEAAMICLGTLDGIPAGFFGGPADDAAFHQARRKFMKLSLKTINGARLLSFWQDRGCGSRHG